MKVTADNGEVLMNKQDMFEEFNENGISINDSKFLALSVFFTEWYAKRPVSLDVTFNIWDKKGEGSIIGKYRVHTK
jgi:lysophospholipase L1-like esterase